MVCIINNHYINPSESTAVMGSLVDIGFTRTQLLLLLILAFWANPAKTDIGQQCSSNRDCDPYISEEHCKDGWCHCSSIQYNENSLAPECDGLIMLTRRFCSSLLSCPDNSKCEEGTGCVCDEGYIKVDSACKQRVFQEVLQPCYSENGTVYICDLSQHSICSGGKCICFDTFLPNTTSGQCEPEKDFLIANKLDEYRVTPGEYCKYNTHCIEGLECQDNVCSCPSSCTYKKEKEICDCGESDNAVAPICVGVLSGILIIGFWITTINRTIDSHKQKQNVQHIEESTSEQSTPRAYPLTPVASSALPETASAQNTGGMEVPSKETQADQLPTKSAAPYPVNPLAPPPAQPIGFQNPASNPAALPECPPYSFSTPEAPSFAPTAPNEPPPPYSFYPSQDQSLPSHTPSPFPNPTAPPVSESSSIIPCPPNPSTLPYPYNP
ncbi:uncharacterized protein LOC125030394 isoform X2 [Penaeus chinensis]|uniref:uncharacterized protein LOC125030394 isoform X2 n=1 Tax=Penaeus chinensis TaxID=139456 RepID=UPI001FB77BFB|nr:uncharacterized protein LOC125030394 isoform X2 [Penaeus chinensis]